MEQQKELTKKEWNQKYLMKLRHLKKQKEE